ncbi:hypothetical protein Tco_0189616 [Tanacetum coccineum]
MEISTVIEEQDPTWMTPIIEFISKGTLPHEQKDARRIRRTAQRFELRNGVLYRRSFLQPWLRCVGPIQANGLIVACREIHTGSCSNALRTNDLSSKSLTVWYYWTTNMHHENAPHMIKKCKDCQYIDQSHSNHNRANPHHLTIGHSNKDGVIDIAGPFPVVAGGIENP